MAKAKSIDVYTPEIRKAMENAYTNAEPDERIAVVEYYANLVGKSAISVRSVMTRAGYYVKKAYLKKDGREVVKKVDLVEQIAKKIGMTSDQAGSLEKANVKVLETIITKLAAMENDIKALTEGIPES